MKTGTKKIKKKSIKLLIFIIVIVFFVGIIFSTVYLIKMNMINSKYKIYTEKMYRYGLAELYNNKEAKATEKVTNDEMIKIVIAAVSGTINIDDLYYFGKEEQTNKWLKFSTIRGYNTNITEENLTQYANKIDTTFIAIRTLESLQKENLEQAELKISDSLLAKFTPDEQTLLKKAISIDIIENNKSSLSNNPMIKGELNKLAVTIIEKFATIYHGAEEDVDIIVDENKMPSNHKDYPYIIDSIPKEIYEYDFDIITSRTALTPVEAYKYMGKLYNQIDETVVEHFNQILNVDYTTITPESFMQNLQYTVVYRLEENDVIEYVDYVIENKIKLSGKAEPLLPILYNNGEQYILRTKLTFEVLNSDTEYNLLFGDETQKVKYSGKQITMYVDVPMGMTGNSWSLRAYLSCLAQNMITNNTNVIIEE